MRQRSLALALVVLLAGCGAEPVSPLPVDGPTVSTRPASPLSTTTSPATGTPGPRPGDRPPATSSGGSETPACLGAVVYTVDATSQLALLPSLCLSVGAILRVENTGPGTVSVDPADKVARFYEAGVVEVRFLSRGTVTVTITRDDETFTFPVVVV